MEGYRRSLVKETLISERPKEAIKGPIKLKVPTTEYPNEFTFREPSSSTGRLAEDGGASDAEDDGLSVAEDGGDLVAAGTLDVHEEGVGVLHQPLQLVLALLILRTRVQEILGELKQEQ